jgi:hypothetical protein
VTLTASYTRDGVTKEASKDIILMKKHAVAITISGNDTIATNSA